MRRTYHHASGRAELATGAVCAAREAREGRRELELSPIRDAFRDEAGDIVEVEDVELSARRLP